MAIQQRLVNYATLYEESRNSPARTGVLTIRMPDMLNAVTQSVNGCGTGSSRPAGHGTGESTRATGQVPNGIPHQCQTRQWLSANDRQADPERPLVPRWPVVRLECRVRTVTPASGGVPDAAGNGRT